MMDSVIKSFLEQQEVEALELARESDLVEVEPIGPRPYQRYVLHFLCKGLVKKAEGIVEAERFAFGVYFPLDYLRRADPSEVLTLLFPVNCFHPNIRFPFVCPGRLSPGTSLTDIIGQLFELVSYNKATMREDDALNIDACAWARRNTTRFPVDSRPIKRRRSKFRVRRDPKPEEER